MEIPVPKVNGFDKIPSEEPVVYTVAEAAKRMGVDPIDVADMIFDQELKCVTSGNAAHVPVTAVNVIIEVRCATERVLRKMIDRAVQKGVLDVNLDKGGHMALPV